MCSMPVNSILQFNIYLNCFINGVMNWKWLKSEKTPEKMCFNWIIFFNRNLFIWKMLFYNAFCNEPYESQLSETISMWRCFFIRKHSTTYITMDEKEKIMWILQYGFGYIGGMQYIWPMHIKQKIFAQSVVNYKKLLLKSTSQFKFNFFSVQYIELLVN